MFKMVRQCTADHCVFIYNFSIKSYSTGVCSTEFQQKLSGIYISTFFLVTKLNTVYLILNKNKKILRKTLLFFWCNIGVFGKTSPGS
jgi:hypothetical protein